MPCSACAAGRIMNMSVGGRPLPALPGEESPSTAQPRWWVTPTVAEVMRATPWIAPTRRQGKCHRKHTAGAGGVLAPRKPVRAAPVRVKRCGKSAPRRRRRRRHGKPHRVQGQAAVQVRLGPPPRFAGAAGPRVGRFRPDGRKSPPGTTGERRRKAASREMAFAPPPAPAAAGNRTRLTADRRGLFFPHCKAHGRPAVGFQ